MSGLPLLIGVSPRILRKVPAQLGFRDKTLQYLEQSVAHWLMSLGAACVMLPTVERAGLIRRAEIHVRDYAAMLDGLLLQGGTDLDPALYGQPPRHIVGEPDPIRDRFELDLIEAFVAQRKPVFGICRGMQLINVAFGGTLHQDLVAEGVTVFAHTDAAYDRHVHPLSILPGTALAQWYPLIEHSQVNSIHHQAVAQLGQGIEVMARAPDGVIEAIWRPGDAFVLGVQWHPEFHEGRDPDLLPADPLMRAFLDAARRRRAC